MVSKINKEDICPKCGGLLQTICYTSNAPIYESKCEKCGYIKDKWQGVYSEGNTEYL